MPLVEKEGDRKLTVFDETDYRFYLALALIIGLVALWLTTAVLFGMDALTGVISATISLIATVLSFYFVQVSYEKNQKAAQDLQLARGKWKELILRDVEERLVNMQVNIKNALEQFLKEELKSNRQS